jgi:DNA end-binding protein Ku
VLLHLQTVRTIWKGTLNVGRIAIPVGLAPTHAKGDISFKSLHRECGTPLQSPRWCPTHERAVEPDEVVKGYEVAPGQFVLLEPDELAAAAPDPNRAIDLVAFVRLEELYKIFAPSSTYFLAPSEQPVGRRPYALLEQTMRETDTAALVRFVAWEKEQLGLVLPLGYAETAKHVLVLAPVRWPADLLPTEEIEEAIGAVELSVAECDLARELVFKLLAHVDNLELASGQRAALQALVDDKLAGRKIVVPEKTGDEQLPLPPVDLEDALRKSIRTSRRPGKKAQPRRRRTKRTRT